jgi:hypothetical protein
MLGVDILSTLRRMWRGHDEKLAEHAYEEHHDSDLGAVIVPQEFNPYGPLGPTMAAENEGEAVQSEGVRIEDELEHEEPE